MTEADPGLHRLLAEAVTLLTGPLQDRNRDELSSRVLCVGLPGDPRTALGRTLAAGREAGQPTVTTLRQLRCHPEPLTSGSPPACLVRICENRVMVAAAADFGECAHRDRIMPLA